MTSRFIHVSGVNPGILSDAEAMLRFKNVFEHFGPLECTEGFPGVELVPEKVLFFCIADVFIRFDSSLSTRSGSAGFDICMRSMQLLPCMHCVINLVSC